MKLNRTYKYFKVGQTIKALLIPLSLLTQPNYDFRNPTLVSGVNRQVGSVYRFSSVSPGTDALVTILQLTNGITLNSIDASGTGYNEAFQPEIIPVASQNAFVEWRITFVNTGTAVPAVQAFVPATPLDIDGENYSGLRLFEYDRLDLGALSLSDFDMGGGHLLVTRYGSAVMGRNVASLNFPGIDSLNKNIMFTVFSSNISTFTIRMGVDNQSTSTSVRRRCIYFRRFSYNNSSLLSVNPLLSFTGVKNKNNISLQWKVDPSSVQSVILEKSINSNRYDEIPEVTDAGMSVQQYIDYSIPASNIFYRLKMIGHSSKVSYSNILAFKGDQHNIAPFSIYPTIIRSDITLQYKSPGNNSAILQFVDLSGRVIQEQKVQFQTGVNNIRINDLAAMKSGNYIAVLRSGTLVYNQKVFKQ